MDNNKIKIGILTFHFAHNYGAMLQAYALPTMLRKLGYDCEVINYRFPYIDQWSRIERWNDLIVKYGVIRGGLRFIKRIATGYYSHKGMHYKFDYFERKIIPHSSIIYRNKSELDNIPYNVILFGSDQIWNSALTNGVAEEYIGGFECLPGTKKIAYAASCGTSDFQSESKKFYDEYLREFHAIAVRENEFQKTLCSRGYIVECVLDPTLLLTLDDWKKIIPVNNKVGENKYLLIYAFEEEEKLYDLARNYAKEHNLDIIVIAYEQKDSMYGMKVLTDCGPLEFLSLFANAEHTITTSFHGTVFSIIFHKSFHCIPHPQYHERTDSLLEMLGLTDHIVNELVGLNDVETNWKKVDDILRCKRNKSIDYLKHAIRNEK